MGVPQFFSFLRERYPEAIAREIAGRVSSLAFDLNSFFYRAAEIVYGYSDDLPEYKKRQREKELAKEDPEILKAMLFDTILTLIKKVVDQVQPQDTVIFAVDGMAPMAKIQQQRQRRYKSAFEKKSKFFDTNAFSPGTKLMVDLDEFLRKNLRLEIEKGKRGEGLWLPPKVIYSSHLVPGEGEHKIMDLYRRGIPEGPISADGGSHVIHGLDGDLIMLSMLLPQQRVFLMREDITDIINIEILKESIQRDLGTKTAVDDFLVLMYLIGNDFLPRIKTLDNIFTALPEILNLYQIVGQPLSTDDGKGVNWMGLALFLQQLKKLEAGFVQNLSETEYRFPSHVIDNATDRTGRVDFSDFRNGWYDYALGSPLASKDLVEAFKIPKSLTRPTSDQLVNMCIEYLTGMAWTSLYYREGMVAINREWSYPYFYAPLLQDLSSIATLIARKEAEIKQYKAFPTMLEYNVVHQLLCIIPPKSRDLVPEEVQIFYLSQSPIIDQFPATFRFDDDGKNAEWQMHALVPHADIHRIYVVVEFLVKMGVFSRKTVQIFQPQSDFIYPKKGFGDPRKTVIQIRRTTDQIQMNTQPTVGQWGRRTEERRQRLQKLQQPFSEVIVGRNRVQMRPSTQKRVVDESLGSLEERKLEGHVKLITFRPHRRVWRVRPSEERLPPKKSIVEVLAKFDMDYSKVPIIFE